MLGELVLRLVLTGLSPTVGSMRAEGSGNAVAWLPTGPCVPAAPALSVSAVHINLVYCNSKSSLLSSLMFSEQTSLSPLYFVIRF